MTRMAVPSAIVSQLSISRQLGKIISGVALGRAVPRLGPLPSCMTLSFARPRFWCKDKLEPPPIEQFSSFVLPKTRAVRPSFLLFLDSTTLTLEIPLQD